MQDMDMEMIDVSESFNKKDNFMLCIYASLVILVILGLFIYFFGYNWLKPFIEV